MLRKIPLKDLGDRSVIEADRIPLIDRARKWSCWVAAREEIFVLNRPDRVAGTGIEGVVDVHDEDVMVDAGEGVSQRIGKLAIDEDRLCVGSALRFPAR